MAYQCPHCQKPIEGIIAKDRFDEVYRERKEALAKLSEANDQLTAAKKQAEQAEGLKARLEQATKALEAEQAKFGTYQAIAGAGITDPELVAATEWAYSRLPEADRPEMSAWLDTIRQDPSKAPLVLRPHLQAQGQPPGGTEPPSEPPQGGTAPSTPPGATGTPPPANSGAGQYTQAPGTLTAEAIAQMTPEQYKAQRQAILGIVK